MNNENFPIVIGYIRLLHECNTFEKYSKRIETNSIQIMIKEEYQIILKSSRTILINAIRDKLHC